MLECTFRANPVNLLQFVCLQCVAVCLTFLAAPAMSHNTHLGGAGLQFHPLPGACDGHHPMLPSHVCFHWYGCGRRPNSGRGFNPVEISNISQVRSNLLCCNRLRSTLDL